MNNLIITKMDFDIIKNITIAARLNDFKLNSIDFDEDVQFRIGDIYVGKVNKVVKNIQAAFVDIGSNVQGYLPLTDITNPFFVNNRNTKQKLVAGDELLVQIQKDAIKTKAAILTTNLSFNGKFLVMTTGNKTLGISNKIPRDKGSKLKEIINEISKNSSNLENYGVILRTNAAQATKEQLQTEYYELHKKITDTINKGLHRTCFSKIYEDVPFFLQAVKNSYMSSIDNIITDNIEFYNSIKNYLELFQPEDLNKLQLYEDKLLPLYSLYNLRSQLEAALNKRVWLKSGGYLIIEHTEAMTVVDVNTGKFDGKKVNREENFLKINIEAAKELCHQLILRNISGMILVDFISMEKKDNIDKLIEILTTELKKDSTKATFVDITKLGIVEITRKKGKKSINEKINSIKANYQTESEEKNET